MNAYYVSERDVRNMAGDMIAAYADLAAIEICKIADECMARGDLDGQYFWKRVVRSIVAMMESHGQMAN